jgi:hypothetical protein
MLFEENGALIVLINNTVGDCVALRLYKVPRPEHLWHVVVDVNLFCCGGTLAVQLLYGGAGITAHVLRHRK